MPVNDNEDAVLYTTDPLPRWHIIYMYAFITCHQIEPYHDTRHEGPLTLKSDTATRPFLKIRMRHIDYIVTGAIR